MAFKYYNIMCTIEILAADILCVFGAGSRYTGVTVNHD
jgi:hypothetical protein